MTCYTRFVDDSQSAWATRGEGPSPNTTFWFNQSSQMTMADVVTTIEGNLASYMGPGVQIKRVVVRGQLISRAQLANYKAAELLRNNEAFNFYVSITCTIL